MFQGIDLTLLKKFLSELDNAVNTAETLRAGEGDTKELVLVELAKATGLAASVMQEASMVVGDIQRQMMKLQNPTPGGSSDLISKLFGGTPGGGGPLGGDPFGGGHSN